MKTRNNNVVQDAQVPHAPMGAMLNDKSVKTVKTHYKSGNPHSLYYEMDDFRKLHDMYLDISNYKTVANINVTVHIGNCCGFEIDTIGMVFTKMLKARKKESLGEVYKLIYSTNLNDVPLFINHPYLKLIAKWRLLINK